jgi:hypothetical protein
MRVKSRIAVLAPAPLSLPYPANPVSETMDPRTPFFLSW